MDGRKSKKKDLIKNQFGSRLGTQAKPSAGEMRGKQTQEPRTPDKQPGDLAVESIRADRAVEARRALLRAAELMDDDSLLVPELLPEIAALMGRVESSPHVVTRKVAAEILNRTPGRVTQLADEGRLPSFPVMGDKVYRRADVEKEARNERIPGVRRSEE